jgi:UDP-N-acetylglucosamine 2-epimerase (non-hydrolysing)
MKKKSKRIGVIVGTRPEAVKLAPVIQALKNSSSLIPVTFNTGQHREMVGQIFGDFGIECDVDLDVMRPRQSLWGLTSRLSQAIGDQLEFSPVDALLVQGDTTSASIGGLCAFYHKIPVGHVEAGLRSDDMYSPFPEEMNRSLLGRLATWHFAPTPLSRDRLLGEGVTTKKIHLCGNTVVDSLQWMIARLEREGRLAASEGPQERLVLVTCHRRENLGRPLMAVCAALKRLAVRFPDCNFLFPMDYDAFLSNLVRAHLVLSDSGGVQEEATSLGKPILLLRRETERPEGIHAGVVKMVGTNENSIVREASKLLDSEVAWRAMANGSKVFGDGRSAHRIVCILEKAFAGRAGRSKKILQSQKGLQLVKRKNRIPANRASIRV